MATVGWQRARATSPQTPPRSIVHLQLPILNTAAYLALDSPDQIQPLWHMGQAGSPEQGQDDKLPTRTAIQQTNPTLAVVLPGVGK
jgi:hypothetical protein